MAKRVKCTEAQLLKEAGLERLECPDNVTEIVLRRVRPFVQYPLMTIWQIAESCYLCGLMDGVQSKQHVRQIHRPTVVHRRIYLMGSFLVCWQQSRMLVETDGVLTTAYKLESDTYVDRVFNENSFGYTDDKVKALCFTREDAGKIVSRLRAKDNADEEIQVSVNLLKDSQEPNFSSSSEKGRQSHEALKPSKIIVRPRSNEPTQFKRVFARAIKPKEDSTEQDLETSDVAPEMTGFDPS